MENQTPEQQKGTLKPKRIKPDIEGITVPEIIKPKIGGPKLTSEEQKLIEETEITQPPKHLGGKITLPKRKPHYFLKSLLYLCILAALGIGVYKGYDWYAKKSGLIVIDQNNGETNSGILAQDDTNPNPAQENPTTASSTSPATTTPAQTSTSSPLAEELINAKRLKIKNTETGWLNVRKSPSTAAAILTKVYPGDMFIYTDFQNGWYKITLPDKTTGWVSEQYVTKI